MISIIFNHTPFPHYFITTTSKARYHTRRGSRLVLCFLVAVVVVAVVAVVAVKANSVPRCGIFGSHQSMRISSFSKLGNSKVVDKATLAKHIVMSQLLTFASVLPSPLQAS